MKQIEWPTAMVVVAGIAGVVTMACFRVEPEWVASFAAAAIGLAGAMNKLLKEPS
jgi:hypothetical protein